MLTIIFSIIGVSLWLSAGAISYTKYWAPFSMQLGYKLGERDAQDRTVEWIIIFMGLLAVPIGVWQHRRRAKSYLDVKGKNEKPVGFHRFVRRFGVKPMVRRYKIDEKPKSTIRIERVEDFPGVSSREAVEASPRIQTRDWHKMTRYVFSTLDPRERALFQRECPNSFEAFYKDEQNRLEIERRRGNYRDFYHQAGMRSTDKDIYPF